MFTTEVPALQAWPELKLMYHCMVAYIDPGTGSYLFQLLIAALLGAGFAIKTFRVRLAGFFSTLLSRRQKSSTRAAAKADEPSPSNPRSDTPE
jgi:hypothetical protein